MATYFWYTTRDASRIKPGWRVPPPNLRDLPYAKLITENVFEEVRKQHYPSRPSRLVNIFVCPAYPSEFCEKDDPTKTIFEVDVRGKTFGANADYYTHGIYAATDLKYKLGDPEELTEKIKEAAHNYWGKRGAVNEVIVDGTVTIVGPATGNKKRASIKELYAMSGKNLRNKLIKLANDNPDLRKDILPLLRTKSAGIVLKEGDTWESESGVYRVHRSRVSIRFWDLTNAGKRGKNVPTFVVYDLDFAMRAIKGNPKAQNALFSFMSKLTKFRNYSEAFMAAEVMRSLIEKESMSPPGLESRTEKGIHVAPAGFKPISINTDQIRIESDWSSFSVRDNTDTYNLQTCIPAIKGGKADIKVFYRWVKDNQSRIKNMAFHDVTKAMDGLGIKAHHYCAMD